MKDDKQINLQTPYKIKLPACTRKHPNINVTNTGKGNNRRWQATGGQRGQRANSAGRFQCGCTRKYTSRVNLSTPFQGRLITADLQTPYKIKLPACTRKHPNINVTNTGKGNNRRWQAPGGQRGQRANSAGRFRCGCTRKYTSQMLFRRGDVGIAPYCFFFCTLFQHKKHPPTGECFETCAIVVSLSDQTGAFDTLGEILLQEHIHNKGDEDRDQAAGFHPDDLLSGADICVVE